MTKWLAVIAVILIGLSMAGRAACYYTPKCPEHEDVGTVQFANQQKQYEGHTYFLYYCTAEGGHYFWVKCDY